MEKSSKFQKKDLYSVIGVLIMLCFQFIPIQSEFITPIGFKVIGVFLGTIFLWSVGSTVWPSILAVVMLGFYGYMPMGKVVSAWMGNKTTVIVFFLLTLIGIFTYHKCTQYVARFFMSFKVVEGRPWVFTFVVLFGVYVMATFVNPWAGVFLFLPIVHSACETVGFEKTDFYTRLMTIAVIMTALLGFPSAYYNTTIMALTSTYTQVSNGLEMPGGKYMIVTLTVGLLCILAIIAVMRFLLKPDVSKLKSITIEQLNKTPLPPMNKAQKLSSLAIVIFIASMLLPAILPSLPVMVFIKSNISGIAMTLVAILAALRADGKPVVDFPKIMGSTFSWPTYMLIATSILLGSALTSEAVGFTALLQNLLTPIFSGMDMIVFIIALLALSIFLTNLMNSMVYVLVMQPIVFAFSQIANVDSMPIMMLLIFAAMSTAAITPSASPYAATIFAQRDYVNPSDVYKYASIFVLAETAVIMIVGVPLALAIF